MIPNNLFIFELANNHNGSLSQGLDIINAFAEVAKDVPELNYGFKLQYRNLDTFIHNRAAIDNKQVTRFTDTALSADDRKKLVEAIDKRGFSKVCTPFDEESVRQIVADGFDIIKIASCSFTDWPLLEAIAKTDLPIIASTGGATVDDIDAVVSFFTHRKKELALMHCVPEYPTGDTHAQLNQIDWLKARYPSIKIGYSSHDYPSGVLAIEIALAKGATIIERHVCLPKYAHNFYSANPYSIRLAINTAKAIRSYCGVVGDKVIASSDSIKELRRYAFAKNNIVKGAKITVDDVYFAIPRMDKGQLSASDFSKYIDHQAQSGVKANDPITCHNSTTKDNRDKIYAISSNVKDALGACGIVLPSSVDLEISHHYGISKFNKFGSVMITLVNREYCKKLIILMPGQSNPEHKHTIKEETFHILSGDVVFGLGNTETTELSPGELLTIERNRPHSFSTKTGAILEEISSNHDASDSIYTDDAINQNKKRKTIVTHWIGDSK
jgi:sialic acid synthase SpsE/quercetin dioxygenase-like cupin family protein